MKNMAQEYAEKIAKEVEEVKDVAEYLEDCLEMTRAEGVGTDAIAVTRTAGGPLCEIIITRYDVNVMAVWNTQDGEAFANVDPVEWYTTASDLIA